MHSLEKLLKYLFSAERATFKQWLKRYETTYFFIITDTMILKNKLTVSRCFKNLGSKNIMTGLSTGSNWMEKNWKH